MKKGKNRSGININLHFSNRWLYTFIALGILAIIGVGVYAAVPNAGRAVGHAANDTEFCPANQILKMNSAGTGWECSNAGGAVAWSSITGKPAGFADDVDNDVDTDTHGSLSCTTRTSETWTSCDTTCANSGESCV